MKHFILKKVVIIMDDLTTTMRVGIIGMGNMGSKYAQLIAKGEIAGMELSAITRVVDERWDKIKEYVSDKLQRFNSGNDMFDAIDEGTLKLDTVIIVTPHYSHETFAIKALERGINVLCDKPAGVYSKQARNMMEAYNTAKSRKPDLLYGYIFHQRTYPVYMKIKEIVDSRIYGNMKRVNWIVSDWYRSNAYYQSGSWRATWQYDGGGTLLNQCPHNLDLLTWICGVPESVMGFCKEGKYHPIEVEDEVTAYLEWNNGVDGVFIASTGEAPGVNRLEISLDNALLVCEEGKLKAAVLDKPEIEYRNASADDLFAKPSYEWHDIEVGESDNAYKIVLEKFARGEMVAKGEEAINSLYLSNAVYLSSWIGRKVSLPILDTEYEKQFESAFESGLEKKIEKKLSKQAEKSGDLRVIRLVLGACSTNCYIVYNNKTKKCFVLDPADEADKIIEAIESNKLKPQYIIVTHGHTDHILALKDLTDKYDIPVMIGNGDAWRLLDERLINERPYVKEPYKPVRASVLLNEGDEIWLDDIQFKVIEIPGHTAGSIALVGDRAIFTGDTLMAGRTGKTSLLGGDEIAMRESIDKLKAYPEDYVIYPGHRDITTLWESSL